MAKVLNLRSGGDFEIVAFGARERQVESDNSRERALKMPPLNGFRFGREEANAR
jgi:hypothetical protein